MVNGTPSIIFPTPDWYCDSRLYIGSEIEAKIAHNIIRDQFASRFVFYIVIVRSLKRLENLINLPLLIKTKVLIVVSSLVERIAVLSDEEQRRHSISAPNSVAATPRSSSADVRLEHYRRNVRDTVDAFGKRLESCRRVLGRGAKALTRVG